MFGEIDSQWKDVLTWTKAKKRLAIFQFSTNEKQVFPNPGTGHNPQIG